MYKNKTTFYRCIIVLNISYKIRIKYLKYILLFVKSILSTKQNISKKNALIIKFLRIIFVFKKPRNFKGSIKIFLNKT